MRYIRWFITPKHLVIGFIIAIIVIGATLLVVFELQHRGRFYEHIIIAGEDVGGKTLEEVTAKVEEIAKRLERDGFLVQIASSTKPTTIKIPAFTGGLTSDTVVEYFSVGDWKAEIEKAYTLGRSGPLFTRLSEQLKLFVSPKIIEFSYAVQDAAVRSLLQRELAGALRSKQEAYFKYSAGDVEIIPEVIGETVDQEEIIISFQQALSSYEFLTTEIVPEPDYAIVTATKLELISDFARSLANQSYATLKFDGFSTYISGPTLIRWLTLKDEPGISLAINRRELEKYVERNVNPYIDGAPQNSRFEMRDGSLVEIVPGQRGQVVSLDTLEAELVSAAQSMYLSTAFIDSHAAQFKPISLSIELIEDSPKVTKETINQYGIKDLVGTVTTSFKGSTADRRHNIKTGLSKINGLLIAPGQEFSLVDAIGYVTEEEGYKKEYVIKGNESVKELGGGLCQIATTVFRLGLNSGLPITERQNHRYVVGYYGPGLDATIYGPHPDLKFINDTKGYVLLQGRMSGDSLIMELYGQKDDRQVAISEPEITDRIPPPEPKYIPSPDLPLGVQDCKEQARYGMKAKATYDVTYEDGRMNNQVFYSTYQPWAKVCLVGVSLTAQ